MHASWNRTRLLSFRTSSSGSITRSSWSLPAYLYAHVLTSSSSSPISLRMASTMPSIPIAHSDPIARAACFRTLAFSCSVIFKTNSATAGLLTAPPRLLKAANNTTGSVSLASTSSAIFSSSLLVPNRPPIVVNA